MLETAAQQGMGLPVCHTAPPDTILKAFHATGGINTPLAPKWSSTQVCSLVFAAGFGSSGGVGLSRGQGVVAQACFAVTSQKTLPEKKKGEKRERTL